MTHPKEVAAHPELAVLSVIVHGRDPLVAERFLRGLATLGDDDAAKYHGYATRAAGPKIQDLLRDIMTSIWTDTPFAREHFSRGKAEGAMEGERRALLLIFKGRGIQLTAPERARISACTDVEQLERWLQRATTATHLTDIFD